MVRTPSGGGGAASILGLAALAVEHGVADAIMREPITLDDWRAARPIADPIRLFDCSLENDGAAAVLVTSLERARDLRQPAVPVLAQVQYGAPIHTQLCDFFATTAAFGERDGGAVTAGRRLFAQAGIAPTDVDVAMIVEPFTVAVPL